MNVLNKVTLSSLKKNRVRTIITILGVVLSAALITGVITIVTTFMDYGRRAAIYSEGNWYGEISYADNSKIKAVRADSRVSDVFYSQYIGYSKLNNPIKKSKPYICVLGCDDGFFANMDVRITSGRLPQTEDEIILPANLIATGYNTAVGDKITLDVGYRVSAEAYNAALQTPDTGDNKYDKIAIFGQDIAYMAIGGTASEEMLAGTRSISYTVVGTYEEPGFEHSETPGYSALTVSDSSARSDAYVIYFRTVNPFIAEKTAEDLGASHLNTALLMIYGAWGADQFYAIIGGITAIMIGLVVFGSVLLIRNAFAISVSERTRQFGVLASVGATPSQLRASVRFEALCISAVGVPLGILAGIGLVWLMTGMLSGVINMIVDDPEGVIGVWLTVNPLALIAAAVICVATVLLSARRPARRAMKLSPIEAIRQNEDIKLKKRSSKLDKAAYKLLGMPGMLAYKNTGRNKKRSRATVASLSLSVALIVSVAALAQYLQNSIAQMSNSCDVQVSDTGTTLSSGDALYGQIKANVDYKKLFSYSVLSYAYLIADNSAFNLDGIVKSGFTYMDKNGAYSIMAQLYVIDDDNYLQFLEANKLDPQEYLYSDKVTAVVCDMSGVGGIMGVTTERYELLNRTSFDFDFGYSELYKEIMASSTGDAGNSNALEYPKSLTLHAGAVCDKLPWGLGDGLGIYILLPRSMAEKITGDNILTDGGFGFYYRLIVADHEKTAAQLENLIDNLGIQNAAVTDYVAKQNMALNIINLVGLFGVGFALLVSVIAAANVFNTVSTSVILRRRELAMLDSVGITRRDFNRMLGCECVYYCVKSLVIGLVIACGISYLIFKTLMKGFDIGYILPWAAAVGSAVGVVAIVYAAMLYAVKKIKTGNMLEMLRDENT
jgi:ABC-type transport system, involved in lipoprotein release, permease component